MSYLNHLELPLPRHLPVVEKGHTLLCVGLPIAAAPVRVLTLRQNVPVALTKRFHTIANADLLLLPPNLVHLENQDLVGALYFLSCVTSFLSTVARSGHIYCNKVVKLFEFVIFCPKFSHWHGPPPLSQPGSALFKIAFFLPSSLSSHSCISSHPNQQQVSDVL